MFFFTALGAVVGALSGAIDAYVQGKTGDDFAASVWSGVASGAVSGAAADIISFTGATVGVAVVVMAVVGAVGTAVGAGVEYLITGDPVDLGELAGDMAMSAATSALFAYMGGKVPSQKDKIAAKGFWRVAKNFYTQEIQDFGANLAEEALTTITAGVADFTTKVFKRAVEYSFQMWQ